ncbi:MAG: hypothetical protein JSV90_07940 [Methanobacteriota archaeon]|nr:MAG: hypothetical protein JSV90_07940 [Euryarchaeota archaeon]
MDTDSIEKEITSSIREILLSKGVDESHFKIKAKTKTSSAEMPVRAQGIKDGESVVEWPKAVVTMVKMKLSVKFAAPEGD